MSTWSEKKQRHTVYDTDLTKDITGSGNENENSFQIYPKKRQYEVIRHVVVIIVGLHLLAIYGLYLGFTSAKFGTVLFGILTHYMGAFGITAGAHRLWSHRAFKVTWQFKCILLFCQTLAYQHSVIHWARDHRTHHKYSDTDADPHNAKRGFFYSHIGWKLVKKGEEVKEKGKQIDISDLYADPLVRWQDRYFKIIMPIICFIMPTMLPMYLWNETFVNAFCINVCRYVLLIHTTFSINSFAHLWGSKPYDRYIFPSNNPFVSLLIIGEGWHNYHHTFPWDYRASEFARINLTSNIINMFAKIGWAYDLKIASDEAIKSRAQRTGDGSHQIWGWGDKDQTNDDYQDAIIFNER